MHLIIFEQNHGDFFVLTGNGRVKLGETFAEITTSQLEEKDADSSKAKVERSKKNPLRAPAVIAVGVEPSDKHNVILKEEYVAVNSSVQNMLLAATCPLDLELCGEQVPFAIIIK